MFAMCVKDVSLTLNMTKARAQLFRIIVIPSAARDLSTSSGLQTIKTKLIL